MMCFCLQVVKMVVTLVVVFALCWLPLHLFNLIIDFAPHVLDLITSTRAERVYYSIFYTCHWLAMANSFTNPIIYGFLNESFRVSQIQHHLFKLMHICLGKSVRWTVNTCRRSQKEVL